MKTIILLLSAIFMVACTRPGRLAGIIEEQERKMITDSTVVIDMEKCAVESKPLSDVICDVSYLPLETTEESYLTVPLNIKMTDSLIYISDTDGHLRCFDSDGKFLHNAYTKGNGHGEAISMYDFDVDQNFVYILDGAKSSVMRYSHKGQFVDSHDLKFKAIRLKRKPDGKFMFQLAPFTMNEGKEEYDICLTDSNFTPMANLFGTPDPDQITLTSRTPYFENSENPIYLAPIYRRGIYRLEDSTMSLKYYLDFGTPYYEPSKSIDGFKEAVAEGIMYTYFNPFHTGQYLIQDFYASNKAKGLLLIDLMTDKPLFIRNLINDTDNVIRFNFAVTKLYLPEQDMFVGTADHYNRGIHTDEEIEANTSHLNEAVKNILVRNNDQETNPILMFYRLKKHIIP